MDRHVMDMKDPRVDAPLKKEEEVIQIEKISMDNYERILGIKKREFVCEALSSKPVPSCDYSDYYLPENIQHRYIYRLPIAGDGNCFYRSLIITYLIKIVQHQIEFYLKQNIPTENTKLEDEYEQVKSKTTSLDRFIDRINKLDSIESNLSSKFSMENLKSVFVSFLCNLRLGCELRMIHTLYDVIDLYNDAYEIDLAAIVITRDLIYKEFLKAKSNNQYKYFIEENKLQEIPQLLLNYRQMAEDVIVPLSAEALNCTLFVQNNYKSYQNGYFSSNTITKLEQYKEKEPVYFLPTVNIYVLFLNGHYEALISKPLEENNPFYKREQRNKYLENHKWSSRFQFQFLDYQQSQLNIVSYIQQKSERDKKEMEEQQREIEWWYEYSDLKCSCSQLQQSSGSNDQVLTEQNPLLCQYCKNNAHFNVNEKKLESLMSETEKIIEFHNNKQKERQLYKEQQIEKLKMQYLAEQPEENLVEENSESDRKQVRQTKSRNKPVGAFGDRKQSVEEVIVNQNSLPDKNSPKNDQQPFQQVKGITDYIPMVYNAQNINQPNQPAHINEKNHQQERNLTQQNFNFSEDEETHDQTNSQKKVYSGGMDKDIYMKYESHVLGNAKSQKLEVNESKIETEGLSQPQPDDIQKNKTNDNQPKDNPENNAIHRPIGSQEEDKCTINDALKQIDICVKCCSRQVSTQFVVYEEESKQPSGICFDCIEHISSEKEYNTLEIVLIGVKYYFDQRVVDMISRLREVQKFNSEFQQICEIRKENAEKYKYLERNNEFHYLTAFKDQKEWLSNLEEQFQIKQKEKEDEIKQQKIKRSQQDQLSFYLERLKKKDSSCFVCFSPHDQDLLLITYFALYKKKIYEGRFCSSCSEAANNGYGPINVQGIVFETSEEKIRNYHMDFMLNLEEIQNFNKNQRTSNFKLANWIKKQFNKLFS